jgi:hypothetical protein
MAANDPDDPLEAFLSGPSIDRDELGEPPLADSEDPFLDRERIHVRKEADSDE